MSEAASPQLAKLDPETLAIRSRPPRAIRFRRGVIIAVAALGAASIVAVTWIALKPRLVHAVATEDQLSEPDVQPRVNVLSSTPATYGDVPRLGPPLPGDLGKPILEQQAAMAGTIDPGIQQLGQVEAAERERELAEFRAARQSGVLVRGRQPGEIGDPGASTPVAYGFAEAERHPVNANLAGHSASDRDAPAPKAAFVGATDPRGDVNPYSLVPAPSPYTLSAGSVIAASLITGLRSDLPGLVTAQVTENVYDSATGRILLVPQGARLIGSYDSVVAFGQKRALIVWQRIVMPDGSSLKIDNVPATDPSGYAGLQDKVDFHTWQLLKGVALSTLLGIGSELAFSGQSDLIQAIRMSTQDSVSRAGDQITQHNLAIQPTITIRPGAPVMLVVHKDLVFAPWNEEH